MTKLDAKWVITLNTALPRLDDSTWNIIIGLVLFLVLYEPGMFN